MNQYSDFAFVYDDLMNEVDYDNWVRYIEDIIKSENVEVKNILELACGTGNLTIPLTKKNYDMLYSIDKSYINNLKDSESYRTELERLEKIEILYKRFIYGLLCILIVILILIYKHNELYTQVFLYKQIVDFLLP